MPVSIDGAIVVDLRADDPRVEVLEELAMPAVIVGGPTGVGSLPHVWADEAVTVTETVGYLAALGHRRIGRVAGLPELLHTRHRDAAFREAGATFGVDTSVVRSTDYTGDEGARATRAMLSNAERPTAILYDNDIMAVAGLSVAHEMGLVVPRDLSIVAWDDSPLCQLVRPAYGADQGHSRLRCPRRRAAARGDRGRRGRSRCRGGASTADPAGHHRAAGQSGAVRRRPQPLQNRLSSQVREQNRVCATGG